MFHGIMRSIRLKPKEVAENQLLNKKIANTQLPKNLKFQKNGYIHFFHRKKVCDNNCEPSKSLVDTPPIDGSKFFKYVHKFKCLATIPLSKFPEYCCEPFKNRKELYETLDRLRKNNSESKDFENNEMEKILYRMFSSDYSLSFSIDGFGISESGMIYCLKCLKNSTNARVPSTVDSDGMLISEKKPDEYKDGFSRERKLIKDHIRDLLKQIAILNSDIYDLSIFNKTTIDDSTLKSGLTLN